VPPDGWPSVGLPGSYRCGRDSRATYRRKSSSPSGVPAACIAALFGTQYQNAALRAVPPTSMGRVLLAALPGKDLAEYLARADLQRLTSRTITTPAALDAELARVRTRGWALVDQELEDGLRALAAPIRDRAGRVVAAVNISAHASRTSLESMRRDMLPRLLAATARVTPTCAPSHRDAEQPARLRCTRRSLIRRVGAPATR